MLVIAGAAAFAIAAIAVIVGVIIGPGEKSPQAQKPAPQENTSQEEEAEPEKQEGLKKGDVKAPELRLGADGLAEMEITTDPRVAAAAAAQVLMSVDTTKAGTVEEFREEALSRVTRPSENYVGAGDGLISQDFTGKAQNIDELIAAYPQITAEMNYSPTGWWWLPGDSASFAGFASYGAKLESRALEVYNQAEMVKYTEGASWTEPASTLQVNIDPEASFELCWVRVETTTTTADSTTSKRYPVALGIYCDPPPSRWGRVRGGNADDEVPGRLADELLAHGCTCRGESRYPSSSVKDWAPHHRRSARPGACDRHASGVHHREHGLCPCRKQC
ncbi:hypothetical protein [Leucobacter chromiireducens]|uniref:hypothetical protein n=1 Tax=Leucobacter chromiireducens TaxID=283877 RepID=UPI001F4374CB|nr:hypothetical protein [Leucobacter chromiireducens]